MDYPEDDLHEFYFPSDFPKHSHLQMVCSYFRLGPPYGLLTTSLEHYKHQKNYPDQRPRVNNLKNDRGFMNLLTKYADFYLDYDLQDPDNIASKQYLFIDPHTKRVTKRKPPLTYRRNDLKPQAQTKSHYVKKSYSQQSNTKILFQKASETPRHQPPTTISYPQEEMTPNNFPALPAIAKPTKSAPGLHSSKFNDMNNMKQTRSEETSQMKHSHQELLESYSRMDEKMSKIIYILKSLRYS